MIAGGAHPLSSTATAQPASPVIGSRLAGLLVVLVVAALAAAGLNVRAMFAYVDGSRWVSHTHQVLENFEGLYADLNQAIASVRLFVISGEDRELEPRQMALARASQRLTALDALLADNPEQRDQARKLKVLVAQRGDYLREVIRLRRSGGFTAAQSLVEEPAVRELSGRMYSTLEAMESEERRLLEVRAYRDQWQLRFLYGSGGLLLLLILALGAVTVLRLRRELLERSRLGAELAESRLFLESIIEHMPMLVFVKRASDLRFVRLNSAGEKMIGMRREELLGRTDEECFVPEVAEYHSRHDRDALRRGGVHESGDEIIQLGAKGSRHLHVRRVAINDASGAPAYVLGLGEDITERLEAQENIRRLNADLAQKNASLEASNRELESFTYTVSHDLRSPLRAMSSFAQMLEEDFGGELGSEAQRYIRVITDGGARMNRLIDDLLAFARIGRVGLRRSRVDMHELARSLVDDLLPADAAKRPKIVLDPMPAIDADPNLLRQVWTNLIDNALKYSAKREDARVHIGGRIEQREAVYFVEDNGAGFDMRYYDKLFGVFQRLHADAEFSGTGVGLAIVQRIVVRHGGRVWAKGAPGEGACFSFSLPLGTNT